MAFSVFVEKSKKPDESELASALGKAMSQWSELKHLVALQNTPLAEEWVFSGKNYGWSLRLNRKKRAVLYMTPCERYFRVGFALGEKAVQAAQQSGLPESVMNLIRDAPRYAEGRGLRMEVRNAEDVRNAVKLAAIKMAN